MTLKEALRIVIKTTEGELQDNGFAMSVQGRTQLREAVAKAKKFYHEIWGERLK